MQLPAEITVGPLTFQVLCDPDSWREALEHMEIHADTPEGSTPFAYTRMAPSVIYIWPDLSPTQQRLSLVHELFHVFVHIADLELRVLKPAKDAEEAFIEAVTPWLVITLVQNPDVLALFLPGGMRLDALVAEYGRQQAERVNGDETRRTGALPVMASLTHDQIR